LPHVLIVCQVVLRLGTEAADGAVREGETSGERIEPLDAVASDEPDHRNGPRKRWKVQAEALAVLEAKFEHDRFPSVATRVAIAEDLQVNPRNIQVWFQNKRQRGERGAGVQNVGPVMLQTEAVDCDDEFPPQPVIPRAGDHDDEFTTLPELQVALPMIHDGLRVGSALSSMPTPTHYASTWPPLQCPSAQSQASNQAMQLLRGIQMVQGLSWAWNEFPVAQRMPMLAMAMYGAAPPMAGVGTSAGTASDQHGDDLAFMESLVADAMHDLEGLDNHM